MTAVRLAEPAPARSMPGMDGFWVLVAGDLAIFTLMFVSFLVTRGDHVSAFSHARASLDVDRGGVNTLVLLTSSACIATALHRLRDGAVPAARRMIALGIGGGVLFAVLKSWEYAVGISAGHTPGHGAFFVYYFTITGIHLGHVIVGCLVLGIFWLRLRRADPEALPVTGFETAACYWHLVDFLWLVIFPLLYLIR